MALKRHYKIVHTKEITKKKVVIFHCDKCDKEFKTNYSLKIHSKNTDETKYEEDEVSEVVKLKKIIVELQNTVKDLQEGGVEKTVSGDKMDINPVEKEVNVPKETNKNSKNILIWKLMKNSYSTTSEGSESNPPSSA